MPPARPNAALGLRPGDAYDSLALAKRLAHTPAGTDVVSLYTNHGYLFFRVTPTATRQPAGTVGLAFAVAEGRLARLRRVFVTGALPEPARAVLLKRLPLRAGDAFSRAKLIETNRLLAQDGRFDPQKTGLNPQPVP